MRAARTPAVKPVVAELPSVNAPPEATFTEPAFTAPPTPAPPVTISAPVDVVVLAVAFVVVITLAVVIDPKPVAIEPDANAPTVVSDESVATAVVASVPLTGSVTDVVLLTVNVVAKLPEIVSVDAALFATPVPPLAVPSVPVIPVVSGNPVQLLRRPEAGVPNAGVTSVGDAQKNVAA